MNIHGNRFLSNMYGRLVLKNPRVRKFLASLVVRNEDARIELLGAPLWINKRQELGYWNAYKESQGVVLLRDEFPVVLSLALIMDPQDTFVDIGANVGLYSACLSKLQSVYPQMKFYAVEANKDTAVRLKQSLRHRQVTVFEVALSNKREDLEFVYGFSSAVFGVKNAKHHPYQIEGQIEKVPAVPLDDLPIQGDSIVMKLDVEGMEKSVIAGATKLFEEGRVKAVYLDGYDDPSLRDFFLSKGFALFNGRTLDPHDGNNTAYSLLAIHQRYMDRFKISKGKSF